MKHGCISCLVFWWKLTQVIYEKKKHTFEIQCLEMFLPYVLSLFSSHFEFADYYSFGQVSLKIYIISIIVIKY